VTLGKTPPVGTDDERHVTITGWRRLERVGNQDLCGSGRQQIVAAHDFGDPHQEIVHDDRQRIARPALVTRNGKVPQDLRHVLLAVPRKHIVKGDARTVRHAESPARTR